MDKYELRRFLSEKQGGKCVVPNCIEHPTWFSKKTWLQLHRIKPGRAGGEYEDGNVVLVCPQHHRVIEGLTLDEILSKNGLFFRASYRMGWMKPLRHLRHGFGVTVVGRADGFPMDGRVLVEGRGGKRRWVRAWDMRSTGGGEELLRLFMAAPEIQAPPRKEWE